MTHDRRGTLDLNKRIVIFIGPEGSGKSTMARRLSEVSGVMHLSTGDIIRDLARSGDGQIGRECKDILQKGTYLSAKSLIKIMGNRLKREDALNGFILDGGLRTLEETVEFKQMLTKTGRGFPVTVVYLNISREESLERLVDGHSARRRDMDTKEGVESRLDMFYKGLKERLFEIKKHGWKIVEISAEKSPDEVLDELVAGLSN
jgi:adenylate kinase